MTEPEQRDVTVNDARLCYFEWGAPAADRPTYLLVHATGFHARCWDQVVGHVLRQSEAHIISLDMRGHGRSDNTPPFSWEQFGADVVAFIETLDLQRIIGCGHSMGGHSVVQAAARLPARFQRLVLVDPVILSPEGYASAGLESFEQPEDHPVARRRARFANWQEMRDRFADRAPFSLWRPEVLVDYCRWGVLPAADGDGVELACPPVVEATVYLGTSKKNILSSVAMVAVPVTVLRARPRDGGREAMDFSASPTWPELAAQFPHGQDLYRPDLTHFIIMQEPALVADLLTGAA